MSKTQKKFLAQNIVMLKSYKQINICKFSIFQHFGNFHNFLSQKLGISCIRRCMAKSWKIVATM